MRVTLQVERLAHRSPVRWAFDVAVVLAAAFVTAPELVHSDRTSLTRAFVLLGMIAAPLVLRRVWPVPVFAAVLVINTAAIAIDTHVVAVATLQVALYTVVASQPRRIGFSCAGVLEAAALAAAGTFPGHTWISDAILLTALVVATTAFGLYVATRRAYLAELHDRAERLELERDQQVALAAAAERARIAREMHDIVAHHLTVMVAMSDGAIAASARSPERGVEAMRTVSATGRRALADTRRLLGVLRTPDSRDPASADAARQPVPDLGDLDELVSRVRAAGLPVTLEVHGARTDVPTGVQLTVYRLVQEALTNTLKHGGDGVRAVVRLDRGPDEVHVIVDDDGAGATVAVPVGVGGGLTGMRERVHAFGGDLDTGPRQHGGWRVEARLRLDEADA